jgi:two-component system, LuxR family, sensor kinase FixL
VARIETRQCDNDKVRFVLDRNSMLELSPTDTAWYELAGELAGIARFELTLTPTGVQADWSAQMRAILGVPPSENPSASEDWLTSFVLEEDRPLVSAAISALLARGESLDTQFRIRRRGEIRWLHAMARLVVEDGSAPRRVVGVVQDQTEQKLAEHSAQTLLERVQNVGRWSLVGEIASGVAHELNQPLAAIATFAQAGERLLILDPPRVERALGIFQELSREALRGGETIRRMRGLVKKQYANPQAADCNLIVADFLLLAEPVLRTSGLILKTQFAAASPTVRADAAQIQQALMILLRNAIDATKESPDGANQIAIATELLPKGVEVSVTDSGPGVSEAVAQQLFKPFFTTKEQGTGLDLLICNNILDQHASRLDFANIDGGGCRFAFVLPYAVAAGD